MLSKSERRVALVDGLFARRSYSSEFIHPDVPKIWKSRTSYADSIKPLRVPLRTRKPLPGRNSYVDPRNVARGLGLIDADSNSSAVCACTRGPSTQIGPINESVVTRNIGYRTLPRQIGERLEVWRQLITGSRPCRRRSSCQRT